LEEVRARHADTEPADPLAQRYQVVGDGLAARRRIGRVVAGERLEEQRAVLHRPRHRARVVEGPGERDDARAAHAPVGRLEADNVAERHGSAERAARVRAGRAVGEPGGERRGRAAGGATGHVLEAPRVLRRLEAVAWELEAESELVRDELAEHHAAGALEPRSEERRVGKEGRSGYAVLEG